MSRGLPAIGTPLLRWVSTPWTPNVLYENGEWFEGVLRKREILTMHKVHLRMGSVPKTFSLTNSFDQLEYWSFCSGFQCNDKWRKFLIIFSKANFTLSVTTTSLTNREAFSMTDCTLQWRALASLSVPFNKSNVLLVDRKQRKWRVTPSIERFSHSKMSISNAP